jgi:hypothetical protein
MHAEFMGVLPVHRFGQRGAGRQPLGIDTASIQMTYHVVIRVEEYVAGSSENPEDTPQGGTS